MSGIQGEITKVTERTLENGTTFLNWSSDKGYHGQLVITYNGTGGYNIDAEYLGLEIMTSILTKWQESKIINEDK